LPIFEAIHEQNDEEAEESDFEEADSCIEDDTLSFIEMEEDIIAFCDPDIKSPTAIEDHNSSLNTTVESHHESAESANQIDSDSMGTSKGFCFDIAAQLNLANEEQNDSFNANQIFDF